MAPITQYDTFTSPLAPAQVRERVWQWFSATVPFTVNVDTGDRLDIETGSQAKMRLIGGAFIAASSLPTHTTVTMTPAGTGTQIQVWVKDTVGFGIKTGMKGKYATWLAQIVNGIRGAAAA
ncbi:MAG TPA: hypothetical protein VEP49_16780 [Acidimicrobiia bacterium]|nr:hypothetical protein [Acidimicrobiia bacterium]